MECFRLQEAVKVRCIKPCEGIYADITKEEVEFIDEYSTGMKEIFEAYENFKNQFLDVTKFPPAIIGIQQ